MTMVVMIMILMMMIKHNKELKKSFVSVTDKHLKYFFKQPQKQMQLIKNQQVTAKTLICFIYFSVIWM